MLIRQECEYHIMKQVMVTTSGMQNIISLNSCKIRSKKKKTIKTKTEETHQVLADFSYLIVALY